MAPSIRVSYLIYATARSGSTLLCDLLESSGLAGAPDEHFITGNSTLRPPTWQERRAQLPFPEFVREIVETTATPNGVFGSKFGWYHHHHFVRRLRAYSEFADLTDQQVLDTFFPNLRYIFLTRRDKVRQAVSGWKALQSDQWNTLTTEWNGPAQKRPLDFSYSFINDLVWQMIQSEMDVAGYFSSIGVVPLTVTYEDLALDPAGQLRRVFEYLEIEVPSDFTYPTPRLQKQVDEVNERWTSRFLKRKLNEVRLFRIAGLPFLIVRKPSVARRYIPYRILLWRDRVRGRDGNW